MDIRVRRLGVPLLGRRRTPRDLTAILAETRPVSPPVAARSVSRADVTSRGFERQRELDRECAEVTAAILLASGRRVGAVTVCNLRQAPVVVRALRGVAAELCVDLATIPRPDGAGTDVAARPH